MSEMRNASLFYRPLHLNEWSLILFAFVLAGFNAVGATYTTPRALNVGDIYELRRDGWNDPPGGPAYDGDVLPKTDANDGAGRDNRYFSGIMWPVRGQLISVIGSLAPISTRVSRIRLANGGSITFRRSRFSGRVVMRLTHRIAGPPIEPRIPLSIGFTMRSAQTRFSATNAF